MKTLSLLIILVVGLYEQSNAQQTDTLIKKLDSLGRKTDSAGGQNNNIEEVAYNEVTKITFKNYFVLLGSDLKQGFTKPFHMTGRDWGKLAKFGLVMGALTFVDKPIQRYAVG